jgi:hypothetical protein
VTPIEAVWARAPLVPVTVTVYDPAADDASVQVDVCVPLMLVGEHVVVTPEGFDEADKATLPVNPPLVVMPIVEVALWPATNETLTGFAESEKSGAGGVPTVTPIDAVRTRDPFVPVIVTE